MQDESWMRAMILRHSTAIVEAQRREIAEMDRLITDISTNGAAETAEEANARPIPDFAGVTERSCSIEETKSVHGTSRPEQLEPRDP